MTFSGSTRILVALLVAGAHQQIAAGQDTSVYYNDRDVDLAGWVEEALTEVKRAWFTSIPNTAGVYAGHTVMAMFVRRDGRIVALTHVVRSGVPGFDNAAEKAIRQTSLPPLPIVYPDERFEIVVVFWINERPYDIFDDRAADVLERLRRAKLGNADEALIDAAARGDVDQVRAALRDGTAIDARDGEGRTALMVASDAEQLELVRLLLEAGANVNATTDDGLNALAYATGDELSELLKAHGSEKEWDTEPELLHKPPEPKCPERARRANISPTVVLRIKVCTDGTTEVLRVIESLPDCDDIAKGNVARWRWRPATRGEETVAALGTVRVTFE